MALRFLERMIVFVVFFLLFLVRGQNFVTVGQTPAGAMTATSVDGVNWSRDETSFSSSESLSAVAFLSAQDAFYVVGGGGASGPVVSVSSSGGPGTWSSLVNPASGLVTSFSCMAVSGDRIVLGARGGTLAAPAFVQKNQIIYRGDQNGPFTSVPATSGNFANGASTGYATMCGYSDGLFVMGIKTPNGNVLIHSQDDGAQWEEDDVPPQLQAVSTTLLAMIEGGRWNLAGASNSLDPVSYDDNRPKFQNWDESDPFSPGTLFQTRKGLVVDDNDVFAIGVMTSAESTFLHGMNRNAPNQWDAAIATPPLEIGAQIENIRWLSSTSSFYAIVSSNSSCQLYQGAADAETWNRLGSLSGTCQDLAVRSSTFVTSTISSSSTSMTTTTAGTAVPTTNPSPTVTPGSNFTVSGNVTVQSIVFGPGSGLSIGEGGVLTIVNASNFDGVTIYLNTSLVEGEVVVVNTPNRPSEGTPTGVVLINDDGICRTGQVNQQATTISIVIVQTPCESTGLSTNQIIGIAVGAAVVGIIVAGVLVFFMVRLRRKQTRDMAGEIRASEQANNSPIF